jgi:hypothetical protein
VHALKIFQINSAILKVPDGALLRYTRIPAAEQLPWNLRCLTEQCTIGNLYIEIDDTGHFLQGALYTIAARACAGSMLDGVRACARASHLLMLYIRTYVRISGIVYHTGIASESRD